MGLNISKDCAEREDEKAFMDEAVFETCLGMTVVDEYGVGGITSLREQIKIE